MTNLARLPFLPGLPRQRKVRELFQCFLYLIQIFGLYHFAFVFVALDLISTKWNNIWGRLCVKTSLKLLSFWHKNIGILKYANLWMQYNSVLKPFLFVCVCVNVMIFRCIFKKYYLNSCTVSVWWIREFSILQNNEMPN